MGNTQLRATYFSEFLKIKIFLDWVIASTRIPDPATQGEIDACSGFL
jgi:hypothetical protein